MTVHYFYKTVRDSHIRGKSILAIERGGGIKKDGLDPLKRNASGGASVYAAAQGSRQLNAADLTGFGQCAGSYSYAKDYATDPDHRLLRITLHDHELDFLVRDSVSKEKFASFEEAKAAKEVTFIVVMAAASIYYMTSNISEDKKWVSIAEYPDTPSKTTPENKPWSPKTDSSDDESDGDW